MKFNLLDPENKWLPVVSIDGTSLTVSVLEAFGDNIKDLDLTRPEFATGMKRFLIGLLQAVHPAAGKDQWTKVFENGLIFDKILSGLKKLEPFFDLEGKNRFLQLKTKETLAFDSCNTKCEKGCVSISRLLLETPADKTINDNLDIFVKRGRIQCMCPRCAAMSLWTHQIYAMQGGRGYRSSPTGATASQIFIDANDDAMPLWKRLWLNIDSQMLGADLTRPETFLPWLLDYSNEFPEFMNQVLTSEHVKFWMCPRVVRLIPDEIPQKCDLCGIRGEYSYRKFYTKPAPIKYKGLMLPFILYYTKDSEIYPSPVQSLNIFSDWARLLLGKSIKKGQMVPGSINNLTPRFLHAVNKKGVAISIEVSGFWQSDQNRFSPSRWSEVKFPFYQIEDPNIREEFLDVLQEMAKQAEVFVGIFKKICDPDQERFGKEGFFGDPEKR